MARKRAFKPSFYKILSGYSAKLKLPKKFMEKYGAKVPRNVKLRIGSGSGSGPTWKVRVEKEKRRYFFTSGWADFSRNMRLKQFELVVFAYVGNATFDVTAYATSGVERPSG